MSCHGADSTGGNGSGGGDYVGWDYRDDYVFFIPYVSHALRAQN